MACRTGADSPVSVANSELLAPGDSSLVVMGDGFVVADDSFAFADGSFVFEDDSFVIDGDTVVIEDDGLCIADCGLRIGWSAFPPIRNPKSAIRNPGYLSSNTAP